MRSLQRAAILMPLLLLVAACASAAWQPGGNSLGIGYGIQLVASGPDRAIVAWIRPTADKNELRVQAWTARGEIAPGWSAEGTLIFSGPASYFSTMDLAADGAGGAWIVWSSSDPSEVHLQHVAASGGLAAGWTEGGRRLCSGFLRAITAYGDGLLAAVIEVDEDTRRSRGVVLHHADASGAPAEGWPQDGLRFRQAFGIAVLVDTAQRVIVSTSEIDTSNSRPLGIVVRRLDRNGVLDPSYPPNGIAIPETKYTSEIRLHPDGMDGVFVQWQRNWGCYYRCGYDTRWSATRVRGDGSVSGGWIPSPRGTSVAPDGSGGILVGSQRDGRPSALRLDPDGFVVSGWDPNGSPAMTEIVSSPEIIVTRDDLGGAYLTWWDLRSGEYHLYASRVDATGRRVDGWPETGSVIGPRGQSRYNETSLSVQLANLGSGNVVAVWRETPGHRNYITALRPAEPGPVADLDVSDLNVGFGVVDVRPNPIRGQIVAIVELPGAGLARLELLDAAGRRLDERKFDFARQARGSVRLEGVGSRPAGIYWLRLTQGGRATSKRVVVLD